ncbi:MAG TPA: hypothetical protein DCO79_01045 [Spirochaeta sp.]|nr:hypothetical protein [Spirochaeta sp.]
MKSRRIILIVIIIMLAAAVSFFLLRPDTSDENSAASLYVPEEPAIAVEAARAEMGMVIPSIQSSGLIRGSNEAVIISETRGVIVEVYSKIGAFINEGDPILSVDSNVAELSMYQSEQQFRSAEIDYASVKRAYDRDSASEAEMLRAKSQLAGAEAAYKDSVKRFENSTVKAPFSGFLADLESSLSQGNYINEGTRIGKVIDLSSVRVDLFLGDDEVSKIKTGDPVLIEAIGNTLDGKVSAIALSSDRATGSFRVIVEAVNPYGVEMRSGFSADVRIMSSDRTETIIVPSSAVFNVGGDDWVYVVKDDTALLRRVERGLVSGNRQEILEGLVPGETVLTTGFKSMSDGAAVIPSYVDSAGGAQ